jgi:hypothetical protein
VRLVWVAQRTPDANRGAGVVECFQPFVAQLSRIGAEEHFRSAHDNLEAVGSGPEQAHVHMQKGLACFGAMRCGYLPNKESSNVFKKLLRRSMIPRQSRATSTLRYVCSRLWEGR